MPSIDGTSRPLGDHKSGGSDEERVSNIGSGSDGMFSKKELLLGSKILLSGDIPGLNFKDMNFTNKKNEPQSQHQDIQEEDIE